MDSPAQTTVIRPPQEVAVRTLASDIASLQHGNQEPAPESRTVTSANSLVEETAKYEGKKKKNSRAWLYIIFILVVLAFGYFVVYPYLANPSIISQ